MQSKCASFSLCVVLASSALCAGGVALTQEEDTDTDADTWHMHPVRSFQARIETDAPLWDATHNVFVSGYEPTNTELTFEARYRNALDSVTTSSIEGALMYLQRDCIDVGANPVAAGCQRKNDVKVITFMEITIAQPFRALSYYQDDRYIYPEYCPFVTMQNGQCISLQDDDNDGYDDDTTVHPPNCQLYNGLYASMPTWNIGPCVGAHAYPTDIVAPYPNTVWFSYPNSCVMKTWDDGKTGECRESYRGGLCPFGVEPDGVQCTFAYKILGYLNIDELVGIVQSDVSGVGDDSSSDSGSASSDVGDDDDARRELLDADSDYSGYNDFCAAKEIELHAFDDDNTLGLKNVTAIPFWQNPSDVDANVVRTNKMIAMYNKLAASDDDTDDRMQPLPVNLTALTESNPPCYKNAKLCYESRFGCVRHSYAQVCTVCREQGVNCVMKVPSYSFPTLEDPPEKNTSATSASSTAATTKAATSAASTSATLPLIGTLEILASAVLYGVWMV